MATQPSTSTNGDCNPGLARTCRQCQQTLPCAFFENLGGAMHAQLSTYCVPCHAADMVRRNRKISRLPRKSLVVLRRQKAIDAFVYYFSKLEMGLGQRTHKLYDMSAAARQDRQAMFAERFSARLHELAPYLEIQHVRLLDIPTTSATSKKDLEELGKKLTRWYRPSAWQQEEAEGREREQTERSTQDHNQQQTMWTAKRSAAELDSEDTQDDHDLEAVEEDEMNGPQTIEKRVRPKRKKLHLRPRARVQRSKSASNSSRRAASPAGDHGSSRDDDTSSGEDPAVTQVACDMDVETPVSPAILRQELQRQIAALHPELGIQVEIALNKFGVEDSETMMAKLRKLHDGMPVFRAQLAARSNLDEMSKLLEVKRTDFEQLRHGISKHLERLIEVKFH